MEQIKDPVNLSLGDKISAYAGRRTRETHNNSIWVKVDPPNEHFRSEVPFDILELIKGRKIILAPDGIGTKVLVIDAAGGYNNAGRDIIAMTAGDITRSGGCPVLFSNVLDVSSLGENEESATFAATKQLFDGLVEVANKLKFACVKGETAELSVCVSSPNPDAVLKFNWSGFMLGVVHPEKIITGNTLAAGQKVVALFEKGGRSNGWSFMRATMQKKFGPEWWKEKTLINELATPSTLYDHFLTWLNGWYNVENKFEHYIKPHLICHLSGGSFKSKFFEDVLRKKGLSARLNNLWDPPNFMKKIAEWSELPDEKLYEKLSCGQGVLVVLDDEDVDPFIDYARRGFDINAKVAGEIYQSVDPVLSITSRFSGKTFEYQ